MTGLKLIGFLKKWKADRKVTRRIQRWEKKGRPVPPPHPVKQSIIRGYAEQFQLRVFIETGTFKGDMVQAMKDVFQKIYSIELSADLFEKAKERFSGYGHIELIHGDSGKELGKVMKEIDQPALFWLDGHYSGGITAKGIKDTPIYEELTHILDARDLGHVILIDDARCFGTEPSYPDLDELKDFIRSKTKAARVSVEDDVIRIVPG